MSLKSRTRRFCGSEEVAGQNNVVPTHQFNLNDFGINFIVSHNIESSKENLIFLFESDIHTSAKVFSKTPYSIMQYFLTFISMVQLTSIHISRDKHLTVLLTNEPDSKLEFTFKYDKEEFKDKPAVKEKEVTKIDCNMQHILHSLSRNPELLHKWEFSFKHTNFKDNKSCKSIMSFNRMVKNGEKWKLCMENSIDTLIHFQSPFLFKSSINFGVIDNLSQGCPDDKSQINLVLEIGSPTQANGNYKMMKIENEAICTKDVVKFSPMPHFANCDVKGLEEMLSINDIELKMDFSKMPHIFNDISLRLDHILSALLPVAVDKLNISNYVDLRVKLPHDEDGEINFTLNDCEASLPFGYHLKHGSIDQVSIDYNFKSSCSIYKDNLVSISGNHISIDGNLRRNFSRGNEVLMIAECSENPRTAIFIEYENGTSNFAQVKIYVGGNFITIRGDNEPRIYHDGQSFDLWKGEFEYPKFISDFR
jgi:hypothetical protein